MAIEDLRTSVGFLLYYLKKNMVKGKQLVSVCDKNILTN
jgi:hypothetical protein